MAKRRLTPVAVLLAAVLAMGTGTAKAQETVNIAISSSSSVTIASDRFIVTGVHA